MTKKSKFLNKFLVTASALTITAGANNAMADTFTAQQNNAETINAVGHFKNSAAADAAPTSGYPNGTVINAAGHTIIFNTANGEFTTLQTGNANITAQIAEGTSLQNITGQTVNFSFTADKILKFDGAVNVGTINDAAGPNRGSVVVNATKVEFNGVIGGTAAIKSLTINDAKSAELNANITTDNGAGFIQIGNGSSLKVKNGVTITSSDIKGGGVGQGSLEFAGGATVKSDIGYADTL